MFLGIPHFTHFRDLDHLLTTQQEFNQVKTVQNIKDSLNIKTSDGEEAIQIKIRSIKIVRKREQVSFDDSFMIQHINTFKKEVQKYINSIFGRQNILLKTFKNEQLFPKKEKSFIEVKVLQNILNSHYCNLQYNKAQLFKKDLQYEQKLTLFLTYVCQNCCDQVAGELLLISSQIWQEFIKVQQNELQYQQLIMTSKKVCQTVTKKLQNYKNINFLSFQHFNGIKQKSRQFIIEKLTELIQYLTTTIFLVASQYFLNPYQQKQEVKRSVFFGQGNEFDQFSDFQEQENLLGRKKRKI